MPKLSHFLLRLPEPMRRWIETVREHRPHFSSLTAVILHLLHRALEIEEAERG